MQAFIIGFCVSAGWLLPYFCFAVVKRGFYSSISFND